MTAIARLIQQGDISGARAMVAAGKVSVSQHQARWFANVCDVVNRQWGCGLVWTDFAVLS